MELGREKCAMLIKRSRKRPITEGIKLPNQEKIRTLEKGNLQKRENTGSGHYQTSGDKRKNLKSISQENKTTT